MACGCHPVLSWACAVGSLLTDLQQLLRVLVYISRACPEGPSPPFPASFTSFIPSHMAPQLYSVHFSQLTTFLPDTSPVWGHFLPILLIEGFDPAHLGFGLASSRMLYLISLVIALYCISPISLVFPGQSTGLRLCSIYICLMNGWLIFIYLVHMKWIVWVFLLLGDDSWLMVPGHL